MVDVKYKTLSAGPDGAIYPGSVVSVDEAEADMLINAGYAELTESTPEVEWINKLTTGNVPEMNEETKALKKKVK